ncbi:TIGR02186 family protein, partial [Acinetobacter baumannii]
IFGAVDNSQQPSAESGYYDVVIVVEGVPGRLVARRKNNIAGLWLNTSAAVFDLVPSYYAIASTRPMEEIVPEDYRALHGIGFRHLRFRPAV